MEIETSNPISPNWIVELKFVDYRVDYGSQSLNPNYKDLDLVVVGF